MVKKNSNTEAACEDKGMPADAENAPELAEFMLDPDQSCGEPAEPGQYYSESAQIPEEGTEPLQTGSENTENLEGPEKNPDELSQPDSGQAEGLLENNLSEIPENSQTGTEASNENRAESDDAPCGFLNIPENTLGEGPDSTDGLQNPEETQEPSQTGTETIEDSKNPDEPAQPGSVLEETGPEKPKRKSTRKKPEANIINEQAIPQADAEQSQADAVQPGPEPAAEEPAKQRARRSRRAARVIPIDGQRSVQTDADKLRSDILDLVESLKGRKMLTGTIQGVERPAGNLGASFAVVYHGDMKVIIPADEVVEAPSDFRGMPPGDVMHYLIAKRLGAEIDFVVKGISEGEGGKPGVAAASRLEAMAAKRREYYFGTGRGGNNLMHEGVSAEARVVSVIRAGIFVDIFGAEAYIPLRELSYQRWADAAQHYQPGQRVLIKILGIDRLGRDKVAVTASVKQAGENPYEKALRRYIVGSRYVGTVSMVDTNGVFISLDGGIDCLCSYPKRGRPPRGSRVTVRILGIDNGTNRVWGAITHMTMPR